MTQDLQTTNLNETGRREQSSGFYSWLVAITFFVLLSQVIRLLIVNSDSNIFYNEKFAFSIDLPAPLIYALYFAVFGLVGYYLMRYWSVLGAISKLGFVLIVSGGVANLLERIYFGFVTDYIFVLNGVLNIADCYIFLGALLVIVSKTNSEKIE